MLNIFDFTPFSAIAKILFAIFSGTLLIQLFYYIFFFLKIFNVIKDSKKNSNKEVPVSIIIAARNEADNLKKFLPAILNQDYRKFEVLVVNDGSSDETINVLSEFKKSYGNLQIRSLADNGIYRVGKKLALTLGIKAAQHEHLLFTDADCKPASNKWLKSMQNHFTDNTEFVCGYGGYFKRKGILNKVIRFETFFIALQYMSFAKAGFPYMGIGRNIAYKKSSFINNKGFAKTLHLNSGDDDLYVNRFGNKHNISLNLDPDAFVHSPPETDIKSWIKKKKRHLSTSPYYKLKHKILLSVEPLSRLLFYISFFLLLVFLNQISSIIVLFLLRFVLQQIIFIKTLSHLKEHALIIYSTFFDIFQPLWNMILMFNTYGKQFQWK